jgi:hypothetical protein
MRLVHWLLLVLGAVILGGTFHALSEEPREAVRKPFGIDKRVLWTTSNVKGSPEPPAPYRIEKLFGKLTFDEPLEMVAVPGRDAWIVAERKGKIWTFANDPNTDKKHLLLDVKRTVWRRAAPQFAKNGYLYVSNITDHGDKPDSSRVSRHTVTTAFRPVDPKSEKAIILLAEWRAQRRLHSLRARWLLVSRHGRRERHRRRPGNRPEHQRPAPSLHSAWTVKRAARLRDRKTTPLWG